LYEEEYQDGETFALEDKLLKHFRSMYGRMGDFISLQYGGSIAHRPDVGHRENKKFELLTSLQRYYSNTFVDQHRQNAINLFLGMFNPRETNQKLWDFNSPIVLIPDLKFLNKKFEHERWWEKPLDTFKTMITIDQDLSDDLQRRVSVNEGNVNMPSDSLLKSFPSMRKGITSSVAEGEEEKWTISMIESNSSPMKSSFKSKTSQVQKDPFASFENNDKSRSGSIAEEKKYSSQTRLSAFEKKLKKPYNNVIFLHYETNEKNEDDEDHKKKVRKVTKLNMDWEEASELKVSKLDPEEERIYNYYCNQFKKVAEDIFDKDDEEKIRIQMERGQKVIFDIFSYEIVGKYTRGR
jgi:hypothetical protein